MDKTTTGIGNPANSTMFEGKNVQKPNKNIRADTNTDGINAFVLVDMTSPIAKVARTVQNATIKLIIIPPLKFCKKYSTVILAKTLLHFKEFSVLLHVSNNHATFFISEFFKY